jgi:hypothetical protein
MADPACDLAIYLESVGVGSRKQGASDWWLITGQLVDDSQKQVALLNTGGAPPSYSNTDAIRYPTVQVRILGDVNQYASARAQAEAVYSAVNGVCDVVINGHNYLSLEPMQEPVLLGYREGDRRAEYSLNVLMMTE